jgi:uncharacterized SAM-binding protein YcdF (DUF218 family)
MRGMFYTLSKMLWFVADPSNLALMLIVGGLLLSGLMRRMGKALIWMGALIILVLGLTPAPNWLMAPLESRFPVPDLSQRRIDGIIVLGGAVQDRVTLAQGQLAMNEASERLTAFADLARQYPQAKLFFSGGTGELFGADVPEAEIVRRYLPSFGIDPARLQFEAKSRNTDENVRQSLAVLTPKADERWLLITSSWHMPRAVGIFRKQGWDVLPYPVDFRTAGAEDRWRPFSSVSVGLRRAEVASREWMGLLVYRLTGRTSALFPGP